MEEIRRMVEDPLGLELFELWKEYEEQETVEALYCKDIDKFEMVMQAFEYEKMHLKAKSDVDVDGDDKVNTVKSQVSSSSAGSGEDVLTEPLRTFFVTTRSSMKSPIFRRLDAELREKREAMLKELGWDVTDEERQQCISNII
uniref:HD domain-containing protein n=1 Tax=Chaetoceros debilis TaxID=122233 RepID=A0A7S3VD43_9STRA